MTLLDYTNPRGFMPRLDCRSVSEAVELMVDHLLEGSEAGSAPELVREVMRRESEGSTAIGGGLVIPHARYRGIKEVRLAVATLAEPLAIPAEDDRPVDVVILLVGPAGDPRQMLRVLARLARLVRQESFLQDLRQAATSESLREAFSRAD